MRAAAAQSLFGPNLFLRGFCTALCLLAGPAAAERLDRLTQRSDLLGWEAIGRLDIGQRGFCTGTLIAPDLVLTAAHCLFDATTGERLKAGDIRFRAGLRDGDTIATRAVARMVVPVTYDPTQAGSPEMIAVDVGLVQLANPVPATTASPFQLRTPGQTGARVTVMSYGLGRANALSRETGCAVIGGWETIVALDCLSHPGSSGAPIFDLSGTRPHIVALITGQSEAQDGRRVTLGVALTEMTEHLRYALRTGDGVWPKTLAKPRHLTLGGERKSGGARFLKP